MDWGALILASLGSGVLVTIINALANRKKVEADVVAVLGEHYETRLKTLDDDVKRLEVKVDSLKAEIETREITIEKLKKENAELTLQVEKLTKAIGRRDERIRTLEKQLVEVTARLDAMNGCDDVSPSA